MEGINFLKNAKGIAKNPLGIIALFISLIYGFACLVLSTSSSNLVPSERMPLIWFLILFPLIIMISFLFLVTRHHNKLYGPSDFKNENLFLKTIDIKTQKRILSEESDTKASNYVNNSDIYDEKNERLKNYLIAENLVLRTFEKKYNSPIKRNVIFEGSKYSFDGIIELQNRIVGIEIKYFDKIDKDYIESVSLHYRRRLHAFKRVVKQYYPNYDFLLEIMIIYNKDVHDFQKYLHEVFANDKKYNIDFLEYNKLKRKFGIREYAT